MVKSTKNRFSINQFISYDKVNQTYYENLYLNDFKTVIKIPLLRYKEELSEFEVEIGEFCLENFIYLLAHD